MDTARTTVTAAGLLVMLALPACASFMVVDQQNLPTLDMFTDISSAAPMGQEFTPTLNSLQAVDLHLEDAAAAGAVLNVNVRDGSIGGSLLGTSFNTALPASHFGLLRFDFAAPVALTPGNTYVLEPVWVAGDSVNIWGNFSGSTYSGGVGVLSGFGWDDLDWVFREGPLEQDVIPEPGTAALFGLGLAALVLRRRRKT